jgi:outer membrane biosynthesis protein TonB
MKLVGVISTAVLSLTLGVAAPAYAQQEQHEQQEEQKAKPAQPEEKKAQPEKSVKQEEKPAAQQEKNTKQAEKNTPQEEKSTKQEQKSAQQQEKNAKQQENNAKQEDKNTKSTEKNAQQHPQQAQPAQQAQRAGGNGGGRIPDDRFRANFGREHTFHVSQGDYSNHRFQYGGYWFGFADAWPSNWLYTQDVFVVEINGVYYLCNPMYPGVNIALVFTP